jgi:EAL domain-containing protein (putative c-di-GMP-specific phosphodiesterase class I)
MNIRETGFWDDIEKLFMNNSLEVASMPRSGIGHCLCTPGQLLSRLRISRHRAERNNSYVLLVLIQPVQAGRQRPVQIKRLAACLRASDSLCELDTGQLALLMDDVTDTAFIPLIVERLIAIFAGVRTSNGAVRYSRPYVGATVFPIEGMSDEEILASSEAALAQALEMEPGAYSLSPMVTGRAAMERFELGKDLHKAHRKNEFEVVYQPIVNLIDQRIHAVEVFLRWFHPAHGSLAPELFLPLLEETGLIVPVGEQVLASTCRLLADMPDSCGHFRACINISSRQLEDSGFLLSVLDALYDADLDPTRLQLEFQEGIMVKQSRLLQRILPELHSLGVQLALDHFGTGDAPPMELARLPIDWLKLDRTMVENIVDDTVSQAIATGAMALASAAGMQVAAVGIERQLQSSMLERLGCCEAQGHYYSHTLSAAELRSMLTDTTQ